MSANLKIDIWGPLKGTTEEVDLSDLPGLLVNQRLVKAELRFREFPSRWGR